MLEERKRESFKIRNRHSGEVLAPAWSSRSPSLRGKYLGVCLPWDLRSADLRGVDLSEADLTGRDLSDADLTGASLGGAQYDQFTQWPEGFDPERMGAAPVPANLKGAKRSGADFSGLDLTDADLSGADLTGAKLVGATLIRAKLRGTHLAGADLTNADLSDAVLTGVRADENTRWPEGFDPALAAAAPAKKITPPAVDDLVHFLKALADPNRLRMIGWLSDNEMTGEELASALSLSEATVSHHLAKLKESGVVLVRPEGARRLHRLDSERLQSLLRELPQDTVRIARGGVDESDFEAKVLAAYFNGDRLLQIPLRQKKLLVVLKRLVQEFQPGVRYPEREVNTILKRFHEDCATLRRRFIEFRFMARENSIYWRLE
jgi:biotin operon repressor